MHRLKTSFKKWLRLVGVFLFSSGIARAVDDAASPEPTVFKQQLPLARLHPGVVSRTVRVSPDGYRVAYVAALENGGEAVFINDEQSPTYEDVANDSLSFSPDSRRVTYGALRDGKAVVVADGREFSALDRSAEGMPVWSPDSQRFAFFAKTDGRQFMAVVDGRPDQMWDMTLPGSFTFSPDGSRYAYAVQDGDFGRVVVDGEAGPRYRNVSGLTFSPDGRHFAYVAIFEHSMSVIVDGIEMATAMAFINDTLRFDGPRQLHVVSLRGDQFVREQIDLIGLSATGTADAADADTAPTNNREENSQ